jgi:hypothetical protein
METVMNFSFCGKLFLDYPKGGKNKWEKSIEVGLMLRRRIIISLQRQSLQNTRPTQKNTMRQVVEKAKKTYGTP